MVILKNQARQQGNPQRHQQNSQRNHQHAILFIRQQKYPQRDRFSCLVNIFLGNLFIMILSQVNVVKCKIFHSHAKPLGKLAKQPTAKPTNQPFVLEIDF